MGEIHCQWWWINKHQDIVLVLLLDENFLMSHMSQPQPLPNQQTRELISTWKMSSTQQRSESHVVNLTWHASTCNVYKLSHRYIHNLYLPCCNIYWHFQWHESYTTGSKHLKRKSTYWNLPLKHTKKCPTLSSSACLVSPWLQALVLPCIDECHRNTSTWLL